MADSGVDADPVVLMMQIWEKMETSRQEERRVERERLRVQKEEERQREEKREEQLRVQREEERRLRAEERKERYEKQLQSQLDFFERIWQLTANDDTEIMEVSGERGFRRQWDLFADNEALGASDDLLKLNSMADNNFSDASSPLELQIGNAVTVETPTVQHHTVVVTLEENTEGITQTIDDDNTLGDGVKVMQIHDEMVKLGITDKTIEGYRRMPSTEKSEFCIGELDKLVNRTGLQTTHITGLHKVYPGVTGDVKYHKEEDTCTRYQL